MTDNFTDRSDSVQSPSRSMFAVVPSDAVELARVPKALYVGTGGNVAVRCVDDVAGVLFRIYRPAPSCAFVPVSCGRRTRRPQTF